MKFVIIGGDAAGMSAASRAKRQMPELDVVVLEQTQDVSYSACGMPYNIADPTRDIHDLVVREAQIFRDKQGIDLRTGHRVETIDGEAKTVSGTDADGATFELRYDRLLIATGASPIVPELPGFDLPGVLTLKSLADGARLKSTLVERSVENVVIIGMGYIGLEMAEALRSRGIGVSMIKPRARLLPWLERSMADAVRSELEANDVALHLGHELKSIEASGNQLEVRGEGVTLNGQMVLVAIGVRPCSQLAKDAGLELSVGRSIAVDRDLRTSDPDIFAAGDCADAYHIVSGKKTWVPLALRANRAGWAVADIVSGKSESVGLPGIAGTAVFKVFDLEVARTGLTEREAVDAGFTPAAAMIKARSRAHAHPGASPIWVKLIGDTASGRLLGAQMVGREGVAHRINAPAVALGGQMTVEQFSQTDAAYAPPFGPTWDPMLVAANQLLKKLA